MHQLKVYGVVIVLILAARLPAQTALRQVALSGQNPDGIPDIVFEDLWFPVINGTGDVAFRAGTYERSDPNQTYVAAVFGPTAGAQSPIGLIAKSGDPLLGATDSAVINRIDSSPVLNDSGDVAFVAAVLSPTAGQGAALLGPTEGAGSPLGVVVREGEVLPGLDDQTVVGSHYRFTGVLSVAFVEQFALNDAGDLAFLAPLRTMDGHELPNDQGSAIFGPIDGNGSALGLLAQNGTPVPRGPGLLFEQVGARLQLSEVGDVAFFGVTTGGRFSIFGPSEGSGSPLGLLVRDGDTAPGIEGDVVLRHPSDLRFIGTDGRVGFSSGLRAGSGAPLAEAENQALFRPSVSDPNTWDVLARAGEPATGTDDAAVFAPTGDHLNLHRYVSNERGDIAASVELATGTGSLVTKDNDKAIFATDDDGVFSLVVREGDQAPGLDDGVVFSRFDATLLSQNANGDLAFVARLLEDDEYSTGLFTIIDGEPELIVWSGDRVEVQTGDTTRGRMIESIGFNPVSGFNDQGSLAFQLRFRDSSSGIFTTRRPLACDFDADGDCDQDDINALFATDPSIAEIDRWLLQASNAENTALGSPADTLVVGDLDLSGEVTSADLGLLLNNFGTNNNTWLGGDLDDSGEVTSTDLGLLLNNFGFPSASANAVPEPDTVALFGLGGLCILALRHSKKRRRSRFLKSESRKASELAGTDPVSVHRLRR